MQPLPGNECTAFAPGRFPGTGKKCIILPVFTPVYLEDIVKPSLFAVAAFLLVFPSSLLGYGYPDAMGQGSTLPGTDAVSHGFGGASAVDVGGMNLFGNPSEISGSDIMLTSGVLILKQTVDDGLGKHTLTYAGLGATSFQMGMEAGFADLAVGIAKIRDYTYKGEYFFIDPLPEPVIAGFENLTVDGGVWEAAMGFSREVMPGFRLGASTGYRMGSINYDYYWHNFSESIEDSSSAWSREEGEFAWRAGTSVMTGEATTVGLSYSSESENCPALFAAGIVFGDISMGFPGVGVEAKIYDTGENSSWTGTVFGGIHPEHNLFFRGGLNLSSKGGAESNVSLGLALGASVNFSRMNIDAAFNYNNESRNGNVFGFPEAQTINDIVTGFSVGATIPL